MFIINLIQDTLLKVLETFIHNWPFLLASVIISVVIKMYLNQKQVSRFLQKYRRGSVVMATAAAVTTPLCSCGTTAVVLGMMASVIPWAPIVAFMVASPLTSPQELVYSAGLFGWPFAIAFFIASILLGLLGGVAASLAESRGWLQNQARLAAQPLPMLSPAPQVDRPKISFKQFARELFNTGRQLVVMFFGFAFIGYLLNGLIPAEWIQTLFGSGQVYSVPLAATFGLPFYINTESSLPLVRAFVDNGMSPGSALAFLITGAGTSIGAFTGMLTIARWRVIAIVVGTLWAGAILVGVLYNGIIAAGLI
jgi:uncharacterized membrane protein YraQ (UPF0718 family)